MEKEVRVFTFVFDPYFGCEIRRQIFEVNTVEEMVFENAKEW
jgi:hypothetical protein